MTGRQSISTGTRLLDLRFVALHSRRYLPPGKIPIREGSFLSCRACQLGADAIVIEPQEASTRPAAGVSGYVMQTVRKGKAIRLP